MGPQGPAGADGPPGPQGIQGPQGPSVAGAIVDGVSTLNPGDAATVTTSFDGTSAHFQFGIPRGAAGADGANGADGAPGVQGPKGDDGEEGPAGPQGPAGEVTNAAMTAAIGAAIGGTAQNPTGITPFGGGFSDPPTQAEMQAFAGYVETLRAALAR